MLESHDIQCRRPRFRFNWLWVSSVSDVRGSVVEPSAYFPPNKYVNCRQTRNHGDGDHTSRLSTKGWSVFARNAFSRWPVLPLVIMCSITGQRSNYGDMFADCKGRWCFNSWRNVGYLWCQVPSWPLVPCPFLGLGIQSHPKGHGTRDTLTPPLPGTKKGGGKLPTGMLSCYFHQNITEMMGPYPILSIVYTATIGYNA